MKNLKKLLSLTVIVAMLISAAIPFIANAATGDYLGCGVCVCTCDNSNCKAGVGYKNCNGCVENSSTYNCEGHGKTTYCDGCVKVACHPSCKVGWHHDEQQPENHTGDGFREDGHHKHCYTCNGHTEVTKCKDDGKVTTWFTCPEPHVAFDIPCECPPCNCQCTCTTEPIHQHNPVCSLWCYFERCTPCDGVCECEGYCECECTCCFCEVEIPDGWFCCFFCEDCGRNWCDDCDEEFCDCDYSIYCCTPGETGIPPVITPPEEEGTIVTPPGGGEEPTVTVVPPVGGVVPPVGGVVPPAAGPGPAPATGPAPAGGVTPPADEPGEEEDTGFTVTDEDPPLASFPNNDAGNGNAGGNDGDFFIIDSQGPPLAMFETFSGTWSLINLILAAAGIALAVMMGLRLFAKKDNEEEDEETEGEQRRHRKILSFAIPVLAFLGTILFIITQDMTLKMGMVDSWTLAQAALFAGGLLSYIFVSKKDNEEEQEANGVA
ncbi:MAG: hypothetical protein FWD38_11490 [Oscillospiraceae bacterium]|nr:hypothetical protein [Oscillospiraceae bacterium]